MSPHPAYCGPCFNMGLPYHTLSCFSPRRHIPYYAFHSGLKTELFRLSYPDSTLAPPYVSHHHRLQTYTSTQFSRLDLPGFWPGYHGTETKREVCLLRSLYGTAGEYAGLPDVAFVGAM